MPNSDNKINISDTQKNIDDIQINIGDNQKSISEGYINIGNVQKQFQTNTPIIEQNRGVYAGGYISAGVNTIDYITINTIGNATDFGDLSLSRAYLGVCSNSINDRGVFSGGTGNGSTTFYNTIDYITLSTQGNAIDFGDILISRSHLVASSNGINNRGVIASGFLEGTPRTYYNNIEYITINSIGNSIDFGDLSATKYNIAACSNDINERCIFGGGSIVLVNQAIIEYITINSPSNTTNFGNLTQARRHFGACSNGINNRGVFCGGYVSSAVNTIDYVTINTPSNAIDFGDLSVIRYGEVSTSNLTGNRGVTAGGVGPSNVIDYITISTPSNATDFGDLSVARYSGGMCSNS